MELPASFVIVLHAIFFLLHFSLNSFFLFLKFFEEEERKQFTCQANLITMLYYFVFIFANIRVVGFLLCKVQWRAIAELAFCYEYVRAFQWRNDMINGYKSTDREWCNLTFGWVWRTWVSQNKNKKKKKRVEFHHHQSGPSPACLSFIDTLDRWMRIEFSKLTGYS